MAKASAALQNPAPEEAEGPGLEDLVEEKDNPREEHFKIVNTVRSPHTRHQRWMHPVHARLKQHLGAGEHRVLRSRPLVLSASLVEKHLDEIREKAKMGLIQLQTLDGRVIDPESMLKKPTEADAPPAPPPVPMPNRPLDSAARDKNFNVGENIPQMPGGIPLAQLQSTSENTTVGGIPGPLENEKSAPVDPAASAPGTEQKQEEISDPAADPADDPAEG